MTNRESEANIQGRVFRTETAQTLTITRVFDAPRERVWQAWTDPEQVKRWWGPQGYTSPVDQIDLRVGGKYLFSMRSPEGRDYWSAGVYTEIIPMALLVYTDHFADEHGNVVPASYYGLDENFPLETLVSVRFEDLDGKTRMTLTGTGVPAGKMYEDTREGWNQSFDKLEEILK